MREDFCSFPDNGTTDLNQLPAFVVAKAFNVLPPSNIEEKILPQADKPYSSRFTSSAVFDKL